jgi:hypothetical protein
MRFHPNNQPRSDSAQSALDAFCKHYNVDDKDQLADLLTNLMHWSDANKVDFAEALRRAKASHRAERKGEE